MLHHHHLHLLQPQLRPIGFDCCRNAVPWKSVEEETKTKSISVFVIEFLNKMPATDTRKAKIPRRSLRKYSWFLSLAAFQVIFWIIFLRPKLQSNVSVESDLHRLTSSENNDRFNLESIANKSYGQQIVDKAYRTSGYEDFVTIFCPYKNNTEILPSRIDADFVKDCLMEAHKVGSTPGNIYHDRWPWWFRTLLRDLGSFNKRKFPELVGRWHYLQFKGVGKTEGTGQAHGVAPRLQLCVYEKGGIKSWKKLQCEHNHDYKGEIPNFNQCWRNQPPYDELMSVDTDPNNKTASTAAAAYKSEKAVFLRDPLERFLSGFLDKCVRRRDIYDHCEPSFLFAKPNPNNNNKSDIEMQSPIKNMLWDTRRTFQAYVDTFPLTWNTHFFPQSFFCGGLHKTIGNYDFVGNMGETFYTDLDAMQKRYPGLGTGMESVFKLSQKLSSGKGMKGKFKNKGVETEAASQVLDYYTPHTVRRVLEYYAIDYVSLGLPIPKWAEEMLLK